MEICGLSLKSSDSRHQSWWIWRELRILHTKFELFCEQLPDLVRLCHSAVVCIVNCQYNPMPDSFRIFSTLCQTFELQSEHIWMVLLDLPNPGAPLQAAFTDFLPTLLCPTQPRSQYLTKNSQKVWNHCQDCNWRHQCTRNLHLIQRLPSGCHHWKLAFPMVCLCFR